jgi:hypothetical protein
MPARIDFRALTLEARACARREIRQAFGVSDDDVLVERVGRCLRHLEDGEVSDAHIGHARTACTMSTAPSTTSAP